MFHLVTYLFPLSACNPNARLPAFRSSSYCLFVTYLTVFRRASVAHCSQFIGGFAFGSIVRQNIDRCQKQLQKTTELHFNATLHPGHLTLPATVLAKHNVQAKRCQATRVRPAGKTCLSAIGRIRFVHAVQNIFYRQRKRGCVIEPNALRQAAMIDSSLYLRRYFIHGHNKLVRGHRREKIITVSKKLSVSVPFLIILRRIFNFFVKGRSYCVSGSAKKPPLQ